MRTLTSILISLLLLAVSASADTYLNCVTTEAAWNVSGATENPRSGRTLFCDDFEDGGHVHASGTDAANDGWDAVLPEPPAYDQTWDTNEHITGHWARCSGAGAGGTDCAAWADIYRFQVSHNDECVALDNPWDCCIDLDTGTCAADSDYDAPFSVHYDAGSVNTRHYFAPTSTAYEELYFRFYWKRPVDALWGHQKMMGLGSSNSSCNEYGFMNSHFDTQKMGYWGAPDFGSVDSAYRGSPTWCNHYGQNGHCDTEWAFPNVTPDSPVFSLGNWYFIEVHVKLDTDGQQDGVLEIWADNCGADGLGCTGEPTLRSSFNDLNWNSSTNESRQITCLWLLDYQEDTTQGAERYIDQFIASTTGPIGFFGGETPAESSLSGGSLSGSLNAP